MSTETQYQKYRALFAVLALALTGYFAARNVATWPGRLRYPGELDVVEGRALVDMIDLREGVPIYAPATAERYNSAEYGPLFYLVGARLVDPARPGFLMLRLLSTLGTLGLAAGCALLAWRLARSYFAAVLAALLFLAYAPVTNYGVALHPDTIALLFWYAGFLTAHRFAKDARVLFAALFMMVAFFYKGQYVSSRLAILLFLLLEKRFRLAAAFSAILGLAGLAVFFVFRLYRYGVTRGGLWSGSTSQRCRPL